MLQKQGYHLIPQTTLAWQFLTEEARIYESVGADNEDCFCSMKAK